VEVSDTLDLAGMMKVLTRMATEVGGLYWVAPPGMVGPIRALVYLDNDVTDQVEWHVDGSDLHYRVRPDLDIDTALSAVMRALSEAANQGWRPAHLV